MHISYSGKRFSTRNLPRIPKDLIYRCIIASSKSGFTTNIRRIIKVCMNGGVPVNMLENFDEFDPNLSKVNLFMAKVNELFCHKSSLISSMIP